MFDNYDRICETLDTKIPEIIDTVEYKKMVEFWKGEKIPIYCYYEILEYLFIDLLNGIIKNNELLERILDFMEDMANSKDIEVQNLLQVQILEGLFGLDYNIFTNIEKNLLRPKTLALFRQVKTYFNSPFKTIK
jgi:hypothetical protein